MDNLTSKEFDSLIRLIQGITKKVLEKIQNLSKTCDGLLRRIEKVEAEQSRIHKLESSGSPHTVPAKNVAADGPPSWLVQENDARRAAIVSKLTDPTPSESAPPDPNSGLEQKSKSRILDELWLKIEEAQSRGIGWISIRDMIQERIDGLSNLE